MDPTQQKAINALEPYVLLSKSASSPRAAVDLITQATSAPNTYVFAELLQTPNIQALRSAAPEYACYFTLLEIFAWGIWSDYIATPNLPSLSEAQSHKLRQLTLLTLATSPSTLNYDHLRSALSLPSTRALEDLVISSIYANLLTAKLSPQQQYVDVSSVAPLRDLRPNSVPSLIAVLDDWDARCVAVLSDIEHQVAEIKRKAQEVRRREVENERAIERALGEEGAKVSGKTVGKRGVRDKDDGAFGADGGDEMDLDDSLRRGRPKGAKRGGFFSRKTGG